ncbi:MAG: MMPL family transporter [Myxococcota bacterium]|nr:MMPL family transporter [Myxococcota bacterium]
MSLTQRVATAYANAVVKRPGTFLLALIVLALASGFAASRLSINSNQLDLISQDLQEVKDVKRVIDITGGAGYLIVTLRSEDEAQMKQVADDLAAMMEADKQNVRYVTYKLPVEFIQQNMVLFVKTEDLVEVKKRVNAYLKDQLRRNNPFFIEIQKTEPVKLEVQDIVDKYSKVASRTILDDYNISDDKKMLLLLVKPMWDSNELDKTRAYVKRLTDDLAAYSQKSGVKLVEAPSDSVPEKLMGKTGTVAYGFTGSYKLSLDDSVAVEKSLQPTTLLSFASILLITLLFFRKVAPTLIVLSGMVLGTLLTLGFTYVTVGTLNMVTSMLAGILMGLGVDFGYHFIFRTRIELGLGKRYDLAIRDAIVNAGTPAFISGVATSGAFFVLLVSEFAGFSQFGLLAGFGTLVIGLTIFTWSPALLVMLGRRNPELPARWVGTTAPVATTTTGAEPRVPNPKGVIAGCIAVVALLLSFAIPWTDYEIPKDHNPNLWERFKAGVRFNYNTRALMPEDQFSVILNDEINERFNIAADPIAVYARNLDEAKVVYEHLVAHKDQYPTVNQVVGVYTFVPPAETAAANAKILAEWQEELKEIDPAALPPEMQEKAQLFMKILQARPFDVTGVPDIYAQQFRNLPETRPENHGYLTLLYPSGDLWNGKNVIEFAEQTKVIKTDQGEFRSAGLPILYAKLAQIVLADANKFMALTVVWLLLVLLLDFRNLKLALASLLPLSLGIGVMLGFFALINERLNFMNIVVLPIVLGYGVSHGVYLLHRYLEGVSPMVALRSVGAAVASSTLTTVCGFGALLAASHNGLRSMGLLAVVGLISTLAVSFTLLAAVLQLMHDKRVREGKLPVAAPQPLENA